jgi:uncharacterized protein (TIGR03083 family)
MMPEIDVRDRLPILYRELIELLRGLSADDWQRPTVCAGWQVRDVAAHLLDTDLRRLALGRDQHRPPPPATPIDDWPSLVAFLDRLNADWVEVSRRLSPRLLTDLLEWSGPQVVTYLLALDPQGDALFPVAWAGEERSTNLFDIAREYTERWHHQQQIRDAVGAPPLTSRYWLHPILAIFLRALPVAYRLDAAPGTAIEVEITGDAGDVWTLRRENEAWVLHRERHPDAACRIVLDQDVAWRFLCKGLSAEQAKERAQVAGDVALAEPFFRARAIMG